MAEGDDETTVLVVDDDVDLADTYAAWLERDGYDVLSAYRGDEALEKLDPSVDVLLLDRRMPEIPGDTVLEEARKRDGSYQISMVTAVEPDATIVELPFDEYLTKPVSRTELLDAVERLVVRASLDDDLDDLFGLASKLGTLEAQSEQRVERTRPELESEIQSLRNTVNEKLRELDHPEGFLSLVEGIDDTEGEDGAALSRNGF